MPEYAITCPYCFKTFHDNAVLFRASKSWTSQELDMMESSGMDYDGKMVDKAELARRKLFCTRDKDDALDSFWKDHGGANGYQMLDPNWGMPYIDPLNQETFDRMVNKAAPDSDSDGMIRDRDGFTMRVWDAYNVAGVDAMTRLCRFCHNPLPLPDYGKYPVIFISVVGITGSGKTVYLEQLLNNFVVAIQDTGYHMGTASIPEGNVALGSPLPGATDPSIMRRPIAVTLIKNGNSKKGVTLVLYDIAGENCVAEKKNDGSIDDHVSVGHFVGYCDALLFLIDPKQIPGFAKDAKHIAEVSDVINTVHNIRAAVNREQPSWNGIPVATVLTKSDSLKGQSEDFPANSPLFQPIKHGDGESGQRGFDRKEYREINKLLQTIIKNQAHTLDAAIRAFDTHGFFAVSAISSGVESHVRKFSNEYLLDETNEVKFRALKEWADGWRSRSPEDRLHYPKCSVRLKNGEPIEGGALNGNLETEIIASTTVQGEASTINLTVADVTNELNLESYPSGIPSSLRIEEPILWILWQLGLIGPRFQPDEKPHKRFLETVASFEERMSDYRREMREKERKFYLL